MTRAGIGGIYPQTILKIEKGTRPLRYTEAFALAIVLSVPLHAFGEPNNELFAARVDAERANQRIGDIRRGIDREREYLETLERALVEATADMARAMTRADDVLARVDDEQQTGRAPDGEHQETD